MNNKLILAIIIVALVGIVTATYQINNSNDLTNAFTEVEPDNLENELAADAIASSNNEELANIDGSNPSLSDQLQSSPVSSKSTSNSFAQASGSSSNSASNGINNGGSNNNGGQSPADQAIQFNTYTIAHEEGIKNGASSTKLVDTFTVDGTTYNVYGQYDNNGNIIGETEVNSDTGKITGGAWQDEVTHNETNESTETTN